MLSVALKSIILEECNLVIELDENQKINKEEYNLVWIEEESAEVLTIYNKISVDETNTFKININDIIKGKNTNKESVCFLGIQDKDTNELSKFIIKNEKNKEITINKNNLNLSDLKLEKESLHLIIDEKFYLEENEDIRIILISRFNKKMHILEIDKKFVSKDKIIINLNDFIKEHIKTKDRWDIFIELKNDESLSYGRVGLYNSEFNTKYSKHLNYIDTNNTNIIVPFITIKNEIGLLIDTYGKYINEKFKHRISIKNIDIKNKKIIINGNLIFEEELDFNLKHASLELRSKTRGNNELKYKLDVNCKNISQNEIEYKFEIDINKYKYEQFYWDIYLELEVNREKIRIRLKNPNHKVKSKINNKLIKFNVDLEDNYILYPYITSNNCISLAYRQKGKYETKEYKIREKIAYKLYLLGKPYLAKKDIWLIYEKFSETAQDNSFYFFKYCYENYPNKNIYYIITKDSKDYANVEKYKDKVIHFMSIKHLVYMCAAKLLIASESKGHSYAWRVQTGKIKEKLNKKKMVFLQHGVTALKRVDGIFKKTSANGVDLFVATSEYEKNIIKDYFNYKEDEIIVTGFARWDVLKDKSNELENKEIFFMPTWRNWLDEVPEDEFEKSPYFKNYMEILNSKELQQMLEKNNLIINYFVHPKFKYYIDKFSTNSKNIRIVQPGEMQVNELLMRASLLITDYSSVAWEMYYQNKPTIFYQFDINDYNNHQGSYLDMENELFGDRAMNPTELISKISKYIDNDFEHPKEFVEMRSKYFSHVDDKNCERTYNEIYKKKYKLYESLSIRQQLLKYCRGNSLVKLVWRKLKKNTKLGKKIYMYKERKFSQYKIEYKVKLESDIQVL